MGALSVVSIPHLHLSLLTRAGIFLMSRDAPHWLRVSVASFWKGGKLWPRLWGNAGITREGHSLLSLHWGHTPHGFTVGRAEYINILGCSDFLTLKMRLIQ